MHKTIEEVVDVTFTRCGSIVSVVCLTEAAREWVQNNVALESWSGTPDGFYAETRQAHDICQGMLNDGLICR